MKPRRALLHVMVFYKDGCQIATLLPRAWEAIVVRGRDAREARIRFAVAQRSYRFTPSEDWTMLDRRQLTMGVAS